MPYFTANGTFAIVVPYMPLLIAIFAFTADPIMILVFVLTAFDALAKIPYMPTFMKGTVAFFAEVISEIFIPALTFPYVHIFNPPHIKFYFNLF